MVYKHTNGIFINNREKNSKAIIAPSNFIAIKDDIRSYADFIIFLKNLNLSHTMPVKTLYQTSKSTQLDVMLKSLANLQLKSFEKLLFNDYYKNINLKNINIDSFKSEPSMYKQNLLTNCLNNIGLIISREEDDVANYNSISTTPNPQISCAQSLPQGNFYISGLIFPYPLIYFIDLAKCLFKNINNKMIFAPNGNLLHSPYDFSSEQLQFSVYYQNCTDLILNDKSIIK